jgi:hypothetical protein
MFIKVRIPVRPRIVKITHGFVEILDDAGYWHSVLRVNALVGQVAEVTSLLFGVDDQYLKKPAEPIACARGFPEDASDEATEAHEKDKQWAHFESWIRPDEIARVFEVKQLKKGWPTVFAFMGVLSELYGDSSVRLIVWFT